MATGTVKWFSPTRGFGFVQRDDSDEDAFIHVSALGKAGIASLTEGQRIRFDVIDGRGGRGPRAIDLELVAS